MTYSLAFPFENEKIKENEILIVNFQAYNGWSNMMYDLNKIAEVHEKIRLFDIPPQDPDLPDYEMGLHAEKFVWCDIEKLPMLVFIKNKKIILRKWGAYSYTQLNQIVNQLFHQGDENNDVWFLISMKHHQHERIVQWPTHLKALSKSRRKPSPPQMQSGRRMKPQ